MVTTHPQTAVGQQSPTGRTKRRPSYNRSLEKYSMPTTRPQGSNSTNRAQQKKRSRSVCAGLQVQNVDYRRPSAPVVSSAPRLSIANRFMASYFDLDPVQEDSSMSSGQSRLSVAERFMSKESSSADIHQNSLSTSNSNELTSPFADNVSGRLTIAEAFMKSSGTLPLDAKSSSLKSPSMVSEYDMFTVHEPEAIQSPFDDLHGLDIENYFKPSVDASLDRAKIPPWGGSQDTLVQQNQIKKPIYSQFVEDSQSLSSRDYFTDGGQSTEDPGDDLESGYDRSEKEPPKKQEEPKRKEFREESTGYWLGCCMVSCGPRKNMKPVQEGPPRKKGRVQKIWVICVFLFLIIAAIVIGYIWPRTPLMRIDGASLAMSPKVSETKQTFMTNNVAFESDWLVNITVDNRQNHVPTRLTQVQVVTKDALTGLMIGKGLYDDQDQGSMILPPNAITTIQIPIHVDYQARERSDTTFMNLIRACNPTHSLNTNAPPLPQGQHEALPLHFWITLHFYGMDWLKYNPTVIATPATGGFVCPK